MRLKSMKKVDSELFCLISRYRRIEWEYTNTLETTQSDDFVSIDAIQNTMTTSLSTNALCKYTPHFDSIKKYLLLIKNYYDSNRNHHIPVLKHNILKELLTLRSLLQEEQEVKIEIAFMPYKSSMWDSMESIWTQASKDNRCSCHVVPIPYYDRDPKHNLTTFHYEGGDFSKQIGIQNYNEYKIEIEKPDIIYIHNPYDGINFVTSVDPHFYSSELKKHTNLLVYVPYFIASIYFDMNIARGKNGAPGLINSDIIIAQNEEHKNICISCGCHSDKVYALGSPKIDAAIKSIEKEPIIPENWKPKLKGKRTIMLNFSLGSILDNKVWLDRYDYFFDLIKSNENITVIWRPHPLMKATIQSMRPQLITKYEELIQKANSSSNIILDETPDTNIAFYLSDALISDGSSVIYKYAATLKPIFCLTINPNGYDIRNDTYNKSYPVFDTSSFYYFLYDEQQIINENAIEKYTPLINKYYDKDTHLLFGVYSLTFKEFINLVASNKDPLKEKRIAAFQRSVCNANGTAGEKIHATVLNQLLNITKIQ